MYSTICSVLAITSVLTENWCSHPPIELTIFLTKLIPTLQSKRTAYIEVDGCDWSEGVLVLWHHVGPSLLLVEAFTENDTTN